MPPPPRLSTQVDTTAHRRILDGLRNEILTGNFEPGSRLPSVRELAQTWKASVYTLQTVLGALSKEGWLQLRHGSGTFIVDPRKRFICAGIYQSWNIAESVTTPFTRNLHFALLSRLEMLKKEVQIFTDSRPDKHQTELFPALAEAIGHRRIQCLIAPTVNRFNAKPLAKLSIPTAFLSNTLSDHCVDYDTAGMLPEGVRRLAAMGCRSVGMMSSIIESGETDLFSGYYGTFERAVREMGLVLRRGWVRKARKFISSHELHGYQEFKSFWRLRHKPDGFLVYPDTAVKGVILAILEIGVRTVTRRMKFVFHRNAHVPILCPFPATWAVADEDRLADALVELIQKQLMGEKVAISSLPFQFKELRSSM